MGLFKVAAFVSFLAAALSGFGWPFEWTLQTDVALVAVGLLCEVAAVTTIPQPPTRR